LKPSAVIENVDIVLKAGLAAYIRGAPGIGKSTIVRDYAKEQGFDFIDLRAAQLDPVDVRGVPVASIEENLTRWLPPDFLPRADRGILFLDELNRATRDTQNSLYELILDGRIGPYVLPSDWHIVSAGNREIDGAMVQPMSRALKNRFIHFEMTVDHGDFHNYAIKNNFDERVIAFVHYKPDMLDEMDTAMRDEKGDKIETLRLSNAFATPRSWEFVSRLLKEAFAKGMTLNQCYALIAGAVGEGTAGAMISYCNVYRELPNIDELLKDPKSYKPLKDASQIYALCIGLASRATKNTLSPIIKVLDQLPKEYMTWTIDSILYKDPKLGSHPDYIDWVHNNFAYAT
jgi:hypothetical protein